MTNKEVKKIDLGVSPSENGIQEKQMTELELHIATNTLTDNDKAYLLHLLSKVPNIERITKKYPSLNDMEPVSVKLLKNVNHLNKGN